MSSTMLYNFYRSALATPTNWNNYYLQAILSSIPLVGAPFESYYKVRDAKASMGDYYKTHPYAGFPKYPSQTQTFSSISNSFNFISNNIRDLY